MKKAAKITASILSAGILMTGCAGGNAEPVLEESTTATTVQTTVTDPEPVVTVDQDLQVDPYLQFAIDMYARQAAASDENMMISPASILIALSMTSAGASGDTLTQMTDVLAPGMTPEELQAFASAYQNKLNSASGIDLHSANSLWFNSEYSDGVYDDYLNNVIDLYGAEVNFIGMDSAGEDMINNWVSDETDGMIPYIIPDGTLDESTRAVLVNTIAFDAEWAGGELPFTEGVPFHNSDGSTTDVDMITTSAADFFSSDDAVGFMLGYEGGEYAFMAILPDDASIDANTFASNMTSEDYLMFWNSRMSGAEVDIMLPEFSSDSFMTLADPLIDMGMADAFGDNADFSLMMDRNISIGQVYHSTHIEVDTTGTSAAAATAVVTYENAAEPSMSIELNRPFVYAIVDVDTGFPVFIGTVNTL